MQEDDSTVLQKTEKAGMGLSRLGFWLKGNQLIRTLRLLKC